MTRILRPLTHPRDEIIQSMERIYRYRMTTTSGGNLSIRDEAGDVWITPARVDKGGLRRDDVVCVRADGRVEGRHVPSSEYPFHRAIYQKASRHSTQSSMLIPSRWWRSAFAARCPIRPCFRRPATSAARSATRPTLCPAANNSAATSPMCSFRDFTASCWKTTASLWAAVRFRMRSSDSRRWSSPPRRSSRPAFSANRVISRRSRSTSPGRRRELLPEFTPDPASTREKERARRSVAFVRRGYRQRLMTSTEGSFSARLNDDAFLITSYGIDRQTVSLDDLTLIQDGRREAGKQPSRAALLHQAIYRRHPEARRSSTPSPSTPPPSALPPRRSMRVPSRRATSF